MLAVCVSSLSQKHGNIDEVRRRRILPDLGVHARQIDPLVKPSADPVFAGIGNEVGKPPMCL
jgi:hypothetical protein